MCVCAGVRDGGRKVEGAIVLSLNVAVVTTLSTELVSKVMSEHSRAFVAIFDEAKEVLREVLPTTLLLF